jgi:hypothetical protein
MKHHWRFVAVDPGRGHPAGIGDTATVQAVCSTCGFERLIGPAPTHGGKWEIDPSGECSPLSEPSVHEQRGRRMLDCE